MKTDRPIHYGATMSGINYDTKIYWESFDYMACPDGADYKYLTNAGYTIERHADMTYHVKGLEGLTLPAYGSYGYFYGNIASEETKNVVQDMLEKRIIRKI